MKSKPVKQGIEKKAIVIDAAGKTVGRVASQAAAILMGKKSPAYERNQIIPVSVTIINVAEAKFSGSKQLTKVYVHYTGYPGGLLRKKMRDVVAKDVTAPMLTAISGMIPRNKLKKARLHQLTIHAHGK
jgi:large subunit ribosomal protein L13